MVTLAPRPSAVTYAPVLGLVACRAQTQAASITDAGPEPSSASAFAASAAAPSTTPSASATARVVAKEYGGPLGLTWGQTPTDVRKTLAAKLTFVSESPNEDGRTLSQHYTGSFAGMTPETVEVDFFEKKLIAVVAQFQAKDVRPAARRWLDLVEKTAEVC